MTAISETISSLEYVSVGGNCHPSAADWSHNNDLLAFGAGINIALWFVHDPSSKGVSALLRTHTDTVHAVRFVTIEDGVECIVSGGADKSLSLWTPDDSYSQQTPGYRLAQKREDSHDASINCLSSVSGGPGMLVSGAADGLVKLWRIEREDDGRKLSHMQTITPSPPLIPLSVAITDLQSGGNILALGGTRSTVQICSAAAGKNFTLQAVLSGHEGWIRSLQFTSESKDGADDVLLASASQDKYIRLWRISNKPVQVSGNPSMSSLSVSRTAGTALEPSLTNKIHKAVVADKSYTVMFEALLVGHEDWIYSVQWSSTPQGLQLLSSSADNTLAIWEADPMEGVWYPVHRFGEISAQKGSTTATGSMGGLWNGLWGPKSQSLVALAKTGGWKKWELEASSQSWHQSFGVGGHTKAVRGLSWTPGGEKLLTTSADQTTRLHAQWKRPTSCSWHEFSRPQIHGYDLNCICTLGNASFISGADEKLLRVFDEPDDVAAVLEKLCQIKAPTRKNLMSADIPVLGLSNKSIEVAAQDQNGDMTEAQSVEQGLPGLVDRDQPPSEDYLSKKSLWPEKEKLYGHGFEVNAVAASSKSTIVATCCKASSVDHAVIRLFQAGSWQQILPPLKAHNLTITAMVFSDDCRYLLSVGRDRQWTVWESDVSTDGGYVLMAENPKAHSRMILCAAWIPGPETPTFVTGGREKCIKIWQLGPDSSVTVAIFTTSAPVTSVDAIGGGLDHFSRLALGLENGEIHLLQFDCKALQVRKHTVLLPSICPSLSVTQLSWRPNNDDLRQEEDDFLAIASDDNSVRLVRVKTNDTVSAGAIEATE